MEQFRQFLIDHSMLDTFINALSNPRVSPRERIEGVRWISIIDSLVTWHEATLCGYANDDAWYDLNAAWRRANTNKGDVGMPKDQLIKKLVNNKLRLHNSVKLFKGL